MERGEERCRGTYMTYMSTVSVGVILTKAV